MLNFIVAYYCSLFLHIFSHLESLINITISIKKMGWSEVSSLVFLPLGNLLVEGFSPCLESHESTPVLQVLRNCVEQCWREQCIESFLKLVMNFVKYRVDSDFYFVRFAFYYLHKAK
jgi:hypothetical protein